MSREPLALLRHRESGAWRSIQTGVAARGFASDVVVYVRTPTAAERQDVDATLLDGNWMINEPRHLKHLVGLSECDLCERDVPDSHFCQRCGACLVETASSENRTLCSTCVGEIMRGKR